MDECRVLAEEVALHMPDYEAAEARNDATSYALVSTLLVLNHSHARNKRCLLAYNHHRLNALETLFWETGNTVLDRAYAERLADREIDYYRDYQQLVADYMDELDMDLLVDMQPPKDLVVEVRALQDHGEVSTEFGSLHVVKDSTHFMRRADAEPLIRQNVLEQL